MQRPPPQKQPNGANGAAASPMVNRPPPAKGGPGGSAPGKGTRRPPKTDEEWLNEAMNKVSMAMQRAQQAGEMQKVSEYNESLQTLQKLHDRLVNSPPAQQEVVRQELAAIRRSFA